MKAAIYTAYGPAETVRLADIPTPIPGPGEVLVRVGATSVSTADWRLRASEFPGILWLPGRLMTGLFAPKNQVLGVDMAGTIAAVGTGVTRWQTGQRVFGFIGHGGHAEHVIVKADGALVETPAALTDAEAAALPFGGLSALVFLRDIARLQAGQSVLILGASGGVGAYATQIAKAMGAHVTAVAGRDRADLLINLGADRVIDYRQENPEAARAAYDVVLDCVGATTWRRIRATLCPEGVFVPLNFKGRDLWHLLQQKLFGGPRLALAVSGDTAEDLEALKDLMAKGKLRPVIDSRFALEDIVAAHEKAQSRHKTGAVIVEVTPRSEARRCA